MSSGPYAGGEAEQSRNLDRESPGLWVWGHFQVGCGLLRKASRGQSGRLLVHVEPCGLA